MILVTPMYAKALLLLGCLAFFGGSVALAQGVSSGANRSSAGESVSSLQDASLPAGQNGIAGQSGAGSQAEPAGQDSETASTFPDISADSMNVQRTTQSGLQLGPPERWWDNKKVAKNLGLRTEQKKKMDDIFNANKAIVLLRYQSFVQEQSRMNQLSKQAVLDEASLFSEIDRVSQARAELEKANAHLLLLLRQEMDGTQIERLRAYR